MSTIKLKADGTEKRARVEFQLFRNWLQNGNLEQAETYLKKLGENYPESSYYLKALEMATQAKAEIASKQNIAPVEQDEE